MSRAISVYGVLQQNGGDVRCIQGDVLILSPTISVCDGVLRGSKVHGGNVWCVQGDVLACFLQFQHVVVYCKGVMYTVEMYDSHRRLFSPQALLQQFEWIIDDADNYQGKWKLVFTAPTIQVDHC